VNDRDLDDEFARIIAGWDAEAPDPLPRPAPTPDAGAVDADADTASPADPATPTDTTAPTDASAPTDDVLGSTGSPESPESPGNSDGLDLPIASTTSHVWRGGPPVRDDADALLDRVGTDEPDDDHFVPPSEIDLPSAETDPMFWAIVGGLVGGPLLLLYVLFFDRDGSGWWTVTALAMIVVGFVLLVLRGGTERDPFDDGTRV
jgi:hypothetical protein